jgi:small subunit ribosomal protein S16
MGAKKSAFYRIVVSDSRSTPSGRFLDILGTYDPGTDPATVKLDLDRTDGWIKKGAQVSDTVKSLISRASATPPA